MISVSIRGKIAFWAGTLAGLVVIVFAGGSLIILYHEQLEAVDLEVAVYQRQIARLSLSEVRAKSPQELTGIDPLLTIAVFDQRGQMVRCSKDFSESVVQGRPGEPAPRTIRDSAGTAWRVVTFSMDSDAVVLAYRLDEVLEVVAHLLMAYAFSLPIILLVSAAGGWWVAGHALRPLRELTAAAESIQIDALERRLPLSATHDEIRRLAFVLNAMLFRIEQGFRQAQRFAADASHELRTPLTIMNGEIARLLRTPQLDRAIEENLLSLQEEVARLDHITQQLLLLSRFDCGDFPLERNLVDLSALVEAACGDAELLAAGQGIAVKSVIPGGVILPGDAANLRRAILTLLDNATRYNEPQGQVRCTLEVKAGKEVELRVGNTGPGIPPDSRPRLFQRFFRADPARQRGGHGLGLSLAHEIVRAHGGQIYCNAETNVGWTEFVVTLPMRSI